MFIKKAQSVAAAAAGILLVVGVAAAADRYEPTPEGRVYLNLAFGGARAAPHSLHYGLRVDHDSRFDGPATPMMMVDFTTRGLADASVNGLSVLRQEYRLRQTEEGGAPVEQPAEAAPEEAAPAEAAPAEAAPAEAAPEATAEAAPAEEAPAEGAEAAAGEEVATEGTFLNYGIVDWGLLALGLAGLGSAVAEVANADEDPSRKDSDGDGTPDDEEPSGTPCIIPPAFPPGCTPFTARGDVARSLALIEHKAWLDEGTGHMGDLVEVRD
jgi:hypothetical protein